MVATDPAAAPGTARTWEESARDIADALAAEARQLVAAGRTDEARERLDEALCVVLTTPDGYQERPAYLDYIAALLTDVAALDDAQPLELTEDVVALPELDESGLADLPVLAAGSLRPATGGIELVLNQAVESFVDAFTRPGKYRKRVEAGLERAGRYLPMIRNELAAKGLPADLAYLPLIESAYSISATSSARAHGMWQFIASTARHYGLRVDALVDERRDPVLATRAAVAHLADLHEEFGDWELALAAYNSGAGNVRRAIRATGSRDFWALRQRLPRETRNYVPAFMAAVLVGREPSRYGLPNPVETPWSLDEIVVDDALDLEVLAARLEVDPTTLLDLNPAIRRGLTPAAAQTTLWLPAGRGGDAAATLASLPKADWTPRVMHTVRAGDTLSTIARRHRTSVASVQAANGLSGSLIHPGQVLLVPRGSSSAPNPAERHHSTMADPATPATTYRVRTGDTLHAIARRFGTSVEDLRQENRLRGSRIFPGDVLRIPGGTGRG